VVKKAAPAGFTKTDSSKASPELPAAAPAASWKVAKRSAQCNGCGHAFEDGAYVFSSLATSEQGIHRMDRCGLCHTRREKTPVELLWRTRYQAAPKKAKLDLAALVEVFKQLVESAAPHLRDLQYLVALLLLRHRKLRLVRTQSQGARDFLVVAYPRHRNTMDVEVSDLPKERLEVLRGQLMALFEGGDLSAAPPEAPATAENSGEAAPATEGEAAAAPDGEGETAAPQELLADTVASDSAATETADAS